GPPTGADAARNRRPASNQRTHSVPQTTSAQSHRRRRDVDVGGGLSRLRNDTGEPHCKKWQGDPAKAFATRNTEIPRTMPPLPSTPRAIDCQPWQSTRATTIRKALIFRHRDLALALLYWRRQWVGISQPGRRTRASAIESDFHLPVF